MRRLLCGATTGSVLIMLVLVGCGGGSGGDGGAIEIAGGTSMPLNQATAEVDAFRLQGLLERASGVVEAGFGADEIARVMTYAQTLPPGGGNDQTFTVKHQGRTTLMEVKVRGLEGDRRKVTFATSRDLAQALRPELEAYAR
jgi:hypothetical protein